MTKDARSHASDQIGSLPDHLIELSPSQWALWRWSGLRGAGFPLQEVLKLSSSDCSRLANRLIDAEENAERLWRIALGAVKNELVNCHSHLRSQVSKAFKLLGKGKIPDLASLGPVTSEAVSEFARACQATDLAWSSFRDAFDKANAETSAAVDRIIDDDRFRKAIVWQNRRALRGTMGILLDPADNHRKSRNRQRKRAEELVAIYWQRYCAKNDTIGFFGPVGWARFSPESETIRVEPGADLVKSRRTYFEGWCIDALAQSLAKNEAIRPWIAPRRVPHSYFDDSTLVLPPNRRVALSPRQVSLLHACDGLRTAKQIAWELIGDAEEQFKEELDVYSLLNDWMDEGIILWALSIPSGTRPDLALWQALDKIDDEDVRNSLARSLLEFQDTYKQINLAAARGNAETLDLALGNLESAFTGLTAIEATRAEGKMYAGRTLVYEDCCRDIEVEIGPHILQSLVTPLSLLLTSARWLTFNAAARYRRVFEQTYTELVRKTGAAVVDAFSFWNNIQNKFYGNNGDPSAEFQLMLQERWMEVLAIPFGRSSVNYSGEQLSRRVNATFQAPGPGWQCARYHSPDVMVAADSVMAIQRDDFQLVLGEMHIAANTLSSGVFVEQRPPGSDFYLAIERDIRAPRIVPMPPKHWHGRIGRCQNILVTPKDVCLEFAPHSPGLLNSRAMLIGDFVIAEEGDDLTFRSRDCSVQVRLIDAFAELLTHHIVNSFKIANPGRHTPRISIDRLVIHRESWQFPPAEIEFAFEKDQYQRYLSARRWARLHDLPRFVFYKSPVEVKPCFLDFDSSIYVEIFAKAIRATVIQAPAGMISISEMLPSPDQVWLPDSQGNLYACEFRIVAVDLLADK